jgi:acyl carrier protein
MAATSEEIQSAVQESIVGALGVDDDEVTPDATLLGDLGAESIDLLDILFRLERKLGIKIQASDLGTYVQGGIPDDEFGDANGIVNPVGLTQLKKVMPQIDTDKLAGKLEAGKVMSLFTVQNLVGLVAEREASKVT